jgi:hypothetical protein
LGFDFLITRFELLVAVVDACSAGNLEIDQYFSCLGVSRLLECKEEDVLSFVESSQKKPNTKESAFIAAVVYLEMSSVLLLQAPDQQQHCRASRIRTTYHTKGREEVVFVQLRSATTANTC